MKKVIIVFSFIFIPLVSFSQPVDQNRAKKVAENFFVSKYHYGSLKNSRANENNGKGQKVKNTIVKKYRGHNSYYINNIEGGGWVIVSSHEARGPILAHSGKGELMEGNLSDVFLDWMEQYEVSIDSAYQKNWKNSKKEQKWKRLENGLLENSPQLKSYTTSTRLLDTEWSQSTSIDGHCPGYNDWMPASTSCRCNKCPAGCVAVAIGQIMNYWGYATGDYADFNWWDMPTASLRFSGNPNYNAQQSAVAYLLKRCGDRVGMDYCADGSCSSGADTQDAEYAFKAFGYKDDMNYERKFWHTYNAWVTMLRDEIDAERPVLYRYLGSHAFVCEGHDGDNTFYFNLGWNGDCDGWYDFEDLKSSNCPGDCNNSFDFTDESNHHCIIGIRPNVSTSLTLKNVSISTGASDPWPNKKTYQAKSNIAAAGDNSYFEVNNNAECRLVAGDYIHIKPGFHAKKGSGFHSKVYKKSTLKSTQSDINYPESTLTETDSQELEIDNPVHFSIYPNPTNGILRITTKTALDDDIKIVVMDMLGKTVYQSTEHINREFNFNVESIPNGLYLVKIYYQDFCFSDKILKE